ncbi:anthranilate synthase component I family protein [Streptomyces sp. NPDC053048]|uniref:anthranilate synthase component I family protein n=1 Tax=Streptomyces sp. NPDC053048 TaxID=3365694 RepID=UPI0037D2783D
MSVRVRTVRRRVPQPGVLSAYLALAGRFGRDQVYLLESAAGPARDRRYQFTGFGTLLTVSVTDGVVRLEGVPALREAVLRHTGPLLDAATGDGGPRLRRRSDLWPLLRAVRDVFRADDSPSRFRFGFLAYFGYDTARYIEELPHLIERGPDLPDVHLVLHRGCLVTDLADGSSELMLHESDAWPPLDTEAVTALLADADRAHPAPPDAVLPPAAVADDTDAAGFKETARRCLKHIAVGDIYQVQIGHELTVRSTLDPVDAYRRLRRRNASPYMYLATVAGHTVIGASPELFVRVEDGTVTMRPIAGTVPRAGGGREGEAAAAHRLRSDPKEVAEHTMLVDLCRNDIGRICRADSMDVPDRLVVEGYSHVLHLVSTVTGQAEEGKDGFDVIAALFPAGTMTGTPKIRAMEIIEDMERSRRGLYAGALGLIGTGGYVNLALCIRTLFHRDGVYRTRASAGIVADSVPEREWNETLAKMSATYWAVTGKELL